MTSERVVSHARREWRRAPVMAPRRCGAGADSGFRADGGFTLIDLEPTMASWVDGGARYVPRAPIMGQRAAYIGHGTNVVPALAVRRARSRAFSRATTPGWFHRVVKDPALFGCKAVSQLGSGSRSYCHLGVDSYPLRGGLAERISFVLS